MNEVSFLSSDENLKDIAAAHFQEAFSGSEVYVKIHFGEPGNEAAFTPADVKPVVNALKELNLKPILIDTPVTYESPRNTVEGYEKVIEQRGYNDLASCVVSNDGVGIEAKDYKPEVCREMLEADNLLVLSHVKGHMGTGFGGAIKNLGMGGVTKETKALEHESGQPEVVSDCKQCGTCEQVCPVNAIEVVDGTPEIDREECVGCSICTIECPHNTLEPDVSYFDDLLAQAASTLINNHSGNIYYLNYLNNIAKLCDCSVDAQGIISEDVGFLFSDDAVAIDQASVDLIREENGEPVFKKHNVKDPLLQVDYARDYIEGAPDDYELKSI
ncbi:MAG: DUF362 domain-containing protein [Candidatus Paceibacterota bacterium]